MNRKAACHIYIMFTVVSRNLTITLLQVLPSSLLHYILLLYMYLCNVTIYVCTVELYTVTMYVLMYW